MAKDLTISLEDKPGELERLAAALAREEINILGGCGSTAQGTSEVHIAVEDAAKARAALSSKGIEVKQERDVMLVYMRALPGELDRQTRALSDAGVNIELFYWSEDGRLVVGVDDLAKAKAALYPSESSK